MVRFEVDGILLKEKIKKVIYGEEGLLFLLAHPLVEGNKVFLFSGSEGEKLSVCPIDVFWKEGGEKNSVLGLYFDRKTIKTLVSLLRKGRFYFSAEEGNESVGFSISSGGEFNVFLKGVIKAEDDMFFSPEFFLKGEGEEIFSISGKDVDKFEFGLLRCLSLITGKCIDNPAYENVCLRVESGRGEVVATNGYSLYKKEFNCEAKRDVFFLWGRKTARAVWESLAKVKRKSFFSVKKKESFFVVEVGDIKIFVREGNFDFPDYSTLLKDLLSRERWDGQISLEGSEFKTWCMRLSLVAGKETKVIPLQIRLEGREGLMKEFILKVWNEMTGDTAVERFFVEGEPWIKEAKGFIEGVYDYRKLRSFLSTLKKGEWFELYYAKSSSNRVYPLILKNKREVYLLMPLSTDENK